MEGLVEDPVGRGVEGKRGGGECRFKIRDLLVDVRALRCSQAVLDFLSTTDVGMLVPADEDAESEAPEREKRSGWRRPRNWAPRVRNSLCFSPCPLSWHPRKRARGRVSISFVLSFLSFLCSFFSLFPV